MNYHPAGYTKGNQRRWYQRRWLRITLIVGGVFTLMITLLMIDTWSALGKQASGARLARIQRSPQYVEGEFVNPLPTLNMAPSWSTVKEWFFGDTTHRVPAQPVSVIPRTAADFTAQSNDLQVTWLGHSTLLIEIEGQRFLTDPVWSDHASPGPLFGVKRFFAPPLPLDELPHIDAVIISHDHYDHLDEKTIKHLAHRIPRFIVPLGVGAHLQYWGIDPERIYEMDWWERTEVAGITLVATPARHFSGRSFTDRGATLWAGWAFLGAEHRVFFSGDSALFPGFQTIGDRLGPFDITLMEVGAYNAQWSDVHMGPEQAVRAHQMVAGRLMVPIHWGTFNLAFHGWTEPAERVRVAAANYNVSIAIPATWRANHPNPPIQCPTMVACHTLADRSRNPYRILRPMTASSVTAFIYYLSAPGPLN